MTDKEELKACPFCGRTNPRIWSDEEANYPPIFHNMQVVCDFRQGGCGASSPWEKTKEQAIKAWNNRKG